MNICGTLSGQTIDYCERHDLTFWAEPVNALTNIGFVIAALYAWRLCQTHLRTGPHARRMYVLVGIIACIGPGSFAFHTFATTWAMILDLLPIALFIFAYLRILLLHVFQMRQGPAIIICAVYVAASFICSALLPPSIANGSGGYIAALVLFSAVVIESYRRRLPHADIMLSGCLLFWISLYLRTMDRAWCSAFPLGTHFMWHLLNAAVLAFLVRFLVFNLARER